MLSDENTGPGGEAWEDRCGRMGVRSALPSETAAGLLRDAAWSLGCDPCLSVSSNLSDHRMGDFRR